MSEFLLRKVKSALDLQYYKTNSEWLKDCFEYYVSEHTNATQDEIVKFIISQWLLSDLREIANENASLPPNLSTQTKMVLPGKYILQIDKMYDISTPKFKQLEKIRGSTSANVEVTEKENQAQDGFQAWEPKPKRMLQLFLTDGVQDISAIEYHPLKSLTDKIFPGYKILIKGPVTCRRGVILLEEHNFDKIGGEVENLLITNATENVFARSLNVPETDNPYRDSQMKNTLNNQNTQNNEMDMYEDLDFDFDELEKIEKETFKNPKYILKTQEKQKSNTLSNRVTQYESQTSIKPPSINNFPKNSLNPQQTSTNQIEDDDDMFFEMVNDKAFEVPDSPKRTNKSSSLNANQNLNLASSSVPSFIDTKNKFTPEKVYDLTDSPCKPTSKTNKLSVKQPSPPKLLHSLSQSYSIDNFPDDDFDFDDLELKINSSNVNPSGQKFGESDNSKSKQPFKQNLKDNPKFSSKMELDEVENLDMNFDDEFNTEFNENTKTNTKSYNVNKICDKASTSNFETEKDPKKGGTKRLQSTMSPSNNVPSKMRCLKNTPEMLKTPKITDFMIGSSKIKEKDLISKPSIVQEPKPICDFLKFILENPALYNEKKVLLKGRNTKLSSLKLQKDPEGKHYFILEGTVSDWTGQIDVIFSSEFLEKLIGYDPETFSEKRSKCSKNKELKRALREELIVTQDKLKNMDGFMEIEFKSQSKSIVYSYRELSKDEEKIVLEKIDSIIKKKI